jgi:hypothetical protein
VDQDWFAPYPSLQRWLKIFLGSERFAAVMKKTPFGIRVIHPLSCRT